MNDRLNYHLPTSRWGARRYRALLDSVKGKTLLDVCPRAHIHHKITNMHGSDRGDTHISRVPAFASEKN